MLRFLSGLHFLLQHLVGAFAVDILIVLLHEWATVCDLLDLGLRQYVHPAFRCAQHRPREWGRAALPVERGDEGFPRSQFGKRLVYVVKVRQRVILAGQLDRLAVFSGESAQGVLYLQPELPENVARDVGRVLRYEEQTDAL